ncbi:hypothetical protein [Qipengyuania sp. ASV99]|uniref:hypothetical protein n=1 Tax=Qipengyuania sp. ASV99 TaxID=3399681 RepID=UPI003A4C635F
MKSVRTSALACTAMLALAAQPANAAVDQYSVGGSAAVSIALDVCSAESQLAVRGDGGTDLDFVLRDPSGKEVRADQGIDDYLSTVIENPGGECATFALDVSNLGEEANDFTVVLEPITESSTRVEKFIIQGSETQNLAFKACGTGAQVSARGDGDTDLDFIIRNADGAVVHENADTTDETTAELAGLLSDCEKFEIEVSNLGEVYNALMLVVEPKGADTAPFGGTAPSTRLASGLTGTTRLAENEGPGEYRADANSSITVNLPVCGTRRLAVRGDGDTDLDFIVTDAVGETVHSDADLSDATYVTLNPGEACEAFALEVSNLGDVYNDFTVALDDPAGRGGASGPGEYRVNAQLATKVMLRVCSATRVSARGDGDTDLDFTVTDASGDTVHSDFDMTDQTSFTLDPGGECADFQMEVSNLGDVYNVLTVAFDGETNAAARPNSAQASSKPGAPTLAVRPSAPLPAGPLVGSGAGEYRADANQSVSVELALCEETYVSVVGDGDTDLDFVIRSSRDAEVHSDYDLTDVTFATLSPSGGCETFLLDVENLGDVYNVFTVSYAGASSAAAADVAANAEAVAVEVPADTASTDGNNRNIAILNQTGEALDFIYWSNSATLEWGADRLGDSYTLARGQQWNVNVSDGSSACLFDFKAVTASAREIQMTSINVCEVTSVAFE